MGHLTLRTLGTPEVRHAGTLLAFRTRKTLALLIYLAVEPGLHAREKLTALFWPESDAAHGRAMLRRTLAFLRNPLNETAYMRLIRLHLAAGDRPAALRVYEAARVKLAQELGLVPSPELSALAERIRWEAPAPVPAAQPRPAPAPPPPLQAPLLG